MSSGDDHQEFFSHAFYDFIFQAKPPKLDPLESKSSIILTFLYICTSILVSSWLSYSARAKLIRIKQAADNNQGVSIFTIRVLVLIQLMMVTFVTVNLLLSLLIIAAISGDNTPSRLIVKKILVVILAIVYQLRAMFSTLVFLNIIFEIISITFLIRMETRRSIPEILFQASNRG